MDTPVRHASACRAATVAPLEARESVQISTLLGRRAWMLGAILGCLGVNPVTAASNQFIESAKAVLDTNPALALEFCRQVAGPEAWPVMLEADVRLRNWDAAARVGEAAIEEIDAGRVFPRLADARDEASARRAYADALHHLGRADQAREQQCMAGQLIEPRADGSPCASKIAQERARRLGILKTELLATQTKQPAPPLSALETYRGQTVVAVFWASWCAPCITELEQLGRYHHPKATVVPIDIDHLSFDTKRAYLPLESLVGPEIPQLYVLDPQGSVRFHLRGFDDDGLLSSRLDWMIDAVSQ
jgi:thiol-disulfide isomerase/thioredoxin